MIKMPSKSTILKKIREIENELNKLKVMYFEHYNSQEDTVRITQEEQRQEGIEKSTLSDASSTNSVLDGVFDVIEDALTLFYVEKGLTKLKDIPFNTFEASLFIEDYIKKNFERKKKMYREAFGLKQENKSKGCGRKVWENSIKEHRSCGYLIGFPDDYLLCDKCRIQDLCEQEKKHG